jgi:hypothetical protein
MPFLWSAGVLAREVLANARLASGNTTMTETGWRSRGYLPHGDERGLVQHFVFGLNDGFRDVAAGVTWAGTPALHARKAMTLMPRNNVIFSP